MEGYYPHKLILGYEVCQMKGALMKGLRTDRGKRGYLLASLYTHVLPFSPSFEISEPNLAWFLGVPIGHIMDT